MCAASFMALANIDDCWRAAAKAGSFLKRSLLREDLRLQ